VIIGIIGLVVSAVLGLLKLYFTFSKREQRTPVDDLADHFDALDRGDKAAFARRRRRHLGRLLARRMPGPADPED
jgi:DNA-binding GntR family transcriptional regulator